MATADELRAQRLRILHARFLDGARRYSSLYHVVLRSDQERLRNIFHGNIEFDESAANAYREFWWHAVAYGRFCRQFRKGFVSPEFEVVIGGQTWYGRYGDSKAEEFQCDVDEEGYPELAYRSLYLFEELSQDALDNIAAPGMEAPIAWSVSRSAGDGRNPWLELLYGFFPQTPEHWEGPSIVIDIGQNESLYINGLPWNVFTASARAIEMLIDGRQSGTSLPASSEHTEKLRPAHKRDHLWLKWQDDEGMTPATIRDRWNGMSDEDRRTVCPTKWQKIESEGGREGERDIIKQALKTARRERDTGEN